MASTTTFGDFPGVKVTTAGGAITGVAIGREQKLVLIGNGDPSGGSASVNTATQINSRLDADRKFGDGTDLAESLKDALANGANIDFLYGVMLDELTVTGETFSGVAQGTLANAPIIEDASLITVNDTVDATTVTTNFRYESPPAQPSSSDTMNINPITGEFYADSSSDYEFDYSYPDYDTAAGEAASVIGVEESGILAKLSESENEATDLSGLVNTLRGDYRMALGVQAAQPNANSSDNDAYYDTSTYADNISNDAMFLHAPARKQDSRYLITGALAGTMSGNAINDPIYSDVLTVDDLEQRLSLSEADDLRDNEVIPIRQPRNGGSIEIADNLSTSTELDWERDYWRRRIVDQVILIAKAIGDAIIGRINDEETRNTVQNQLRVELRGLAQDRLIEPNEEEETNWFVDVYEVDPDTVGIDIGITPLGVVKRVDTTITINT